MRGFVVLVAVLGLVACEEVEETHPCAEAPAVEAGAALRASVEGCGTLDLPDVDLRGAAASVRFVVNDTRGVSVRPILTATEDTIVTGLVLRGTVDVPGDAPLRLWRHGYQSWSFSGVVDLEPITLDERGLPEVGGDGDSESFLHDTPFTSWWTALVGRSGAGSILIGAETAQVVKFHAAVDADEIQLIWGTRGESIPLAAGEELTLDEIRLVFEASPFEAHRSYAREVAAANAPAWLPDAPATGWSTWYVFYEDVDEEDVRRNLDFLAARREAGAPTVDVIQVDDGWQRVWGDWRAGDDFPSGMAALAADITAAGFRPGLWMAPLYVDRSTDTWQQNPDWWVRDDDGTQRSFNNFGTGDYAILDVTHPDAAGWLAAQIRDRVAEGWPYLKLDFLYAGAEEGVRAVPMTGMQAYRRAMAIIVDAAGPDTELLASGAPVLPTVGWFHAFRTGADIAFGHDPDPRREFLRWQTRCTAARSWMNGVWWWNDADAILLREPYTAAEAWGAAVSNAVSGGAWLLGDDLPEVPDDGRLDAALDPAVLATLGLVGEPIDPLSYPSGYETGPVLEPATQDDQVPLEWRLGDHTALLNLSDVYVDVDVPEGDVLGPIGAAGVVRMAPGDGILVRVP